MTDFAQVRVVKTRVLGHQKDRHKRIRGRKRLTMTGKRSKGRPGSYSASMGGGFAVDSEEKDGRDASPAGWSMRIKDKPTVGRSLAF